MIEILGNIISIVTGVWPIIARERRAAAGAVPEVPRGATVPAILGEQADTSPETVRVQATVATEGGFEKRVVETVRSPFLPPEVIPEEPIPVPVPTVFETGMVPTALEVVTRIEEVAFPTIEELAATRAVLGAQDTIYFEQSIQAATLVQWLDPITGAIGITSPEAVPIGGIILAVVG